MDKLFFIFVALIGIIVYLKRDTLLVSSYLQRVDLDKTLQPAQWILPIVLLGKILGVLFITSYSLFAIIALITGLALGTTISEFLTTWFEGFCFIVLLFTPIRVLPEIKIKPYDSERQKLIPSRVKFVWYLQIVIYTLIVLNIYHQLTGARLLLKGLRPLMF